LTVSKSGELKFKISYHYTYISQVITVHDTNQEYRI